MAAKKIKHSNIGLTTNVMFDFTGRSISQFIAGLQINYNEVISTEIFLRNKNTLLVQSKIMITKNLQLSYAYDFSFSNILLKPLNLSEFMIIYKDFFTEKLKRNDLNFYF